MTDKTNLPPLPKATVDEHNLQGGRLLYTAAQMREYATQALRAALDQPVQPTKTVWEMFPAYLIDHCEGETITEEGLQRALSDMLADSEYAALAQDDDHKPVDAVTESAINDALGLMQPAVSPGYKLMKRDPSEEMIYAARLEGSVNTDDEIADDYRAMWDAAPEAPAQSNHIGGITEMVPEARAQDGCAYCANPLFAGTKCKNCGKVFEAAVAQEPVWYKIDGDTRGYCGDVVLEHKSGEFRISHSNWIGSDETQSYQGFIRPAYLGQVESGYTRWMPLQSRIAPQQEAVREAFQISDEMVTLAAQELCRIHAGECQVDYDDTWLIYSDQFKRDARCALEAAHGIGSKA